MTKSDCSEWFELSFQEVSIETITVFTVQGMSTGCRWSQTRQTGVMGKVRSVGLEL